jgi:hypothetical protein
MQFPAVVGAVVAGLTLNEWVAIITGLRAGSVRVPDLEVAPGGAHQGAWAVKLIDLVQAKDGSLSLTKLAAATAHLLFALTVAWVTYVKQDFIAEMWMLYIGAAIAHASYDKTMATVKDFKDRQAAGGKPPDPSTVE